MKMKFNEILRAYNKYVDSQREEKGIKGNTFLVGTSNWRRNKAVVKTAVCNIYIVSLDMQTRIKICTAQYTTTILSGHEDTLVNDVEMRCLYEFIKWWDIYKEAYINNKIGDVGGVLDTNE